MKADYIHKDSLTATDSRLFFKMNDEEIKKLMNLLTQGGLRHFVLKLDDEELDVVEYKEYKKLEERIAYLERSIERKDDTIIELELERVPYTNAYVEKVKKENEDLKRQLRYIRSSEYYNQLRFENKMLQDVVDNGKVSKEDRAFIYCTHRNTELVEQQLEFIDYLEGCIREYTPNLRINEFDEDGNRIAQHINAEVFNKQPIEVIKEILQKYKEIIGGNKDENNSI